MSAYDYIIQEAQKIGLGIGKLEGNLEGQIETVSIKNQEFVTSLITNTDFDDAKIAMLVGVSDQYVYDLRLTLKK